MTDPVEIALIGAFTSVAIGVWNGVVLLRLHSQSKKNGENIRTVVEQTNGIQAKLLEETKTASHAEGMAAQRAEDESKQN